MSCLRRIGLLTKLWKVILGSSQAHEGRHSSRSEGWMRDVQKQYYWNGTICAFGAEDLITEGQGHQIGHLTSWGQRSDQFQKTEKAQRVGPETSSGTGYFSSSIAHGMGSPRYK